MPLSRGLRYGLVLYLLLWVWPLCSEETVYRRVGIASYYHDWLHGKRTASGEPYDKNALTAAHSTLRLGTTVKVTHLRSGRSVIVRINDHLPPHHGRLIDLSKAAARELRILARGVARVRVETVSMQDSLEPGADNR